MASGLGGLASGIIAGADLGLRMRRQEQSEREESELGKLRAAREERAVSAEERAGETHAQSMERGEQEITLAGLREQRAASAEGRAVSQEKRAVSQEKRLQSQQDWMKSEADWKKKNENLGAMAPVEYQRVLSGGDFSPEFLEQSKGTKFDPMFMARPEYKKAAKQVYDYAQMLVSGDTRDLNNPQFLDSVNVLLEPDVKKGIGEKDPKTGKTIEDKRIVDITPYQGKGYVFDVETTLSDGSSYTAPITKHRTSNPDDPVKIITPEQLINQVSGHMAMASAFNQEDLQRRVDLMREGRGASESSKETTKRQFLREQGNIDKWEMDQISKLDPDMMTDDEYKKKVSGIKKLAESRRDKTSKSYGIQKPASVGSGKAAVKTPSGGGEERTDVNVWAGDDTKKQAFLAEANAYAESAGTSNPFNAYTPDELNNIYREWLNNAEADEIAAMM